MFGLLEKQRRGSVAEARERVVEDEAGEGTGWGLWSLKGAVSLGGVERGGGPDLAQPSPGAHLLLEPSLHLAPAFPLASCSSLWAGFLPVSRDRVRELCPSFPSAPAPSPHVSSVLRSPGLSAPSCLPPHPLTSCHPGPPQGSHSLSAAVQPPPWPPCLQSLPTSPSLPTVHPVTQNQLFLKKNAPMFCLPLPPTTFPQVETKLQCVALCANLTLASASISSGHSCPRSLSQFPGGSILSHTSAPTHVLSFLLGMSLCIQVTWKALTHL